MVNKNIRIQFTIQEAGCLLYAADRNLQGFPFNRLTEFFGGVKGLKDLTLNGAIMATSLYQDDGYTVRVVVGDLLLPEEQTEWLARAAWKLKLESGEMVVSGVCDEDLEEYMEDFPAAEDGGEYELGCFVQIPAGEYAVTFYSYPPGDLSGSLFRMEHPELDRHLRDDKTEGESLLDYFTRTRPGETPPAWIAEDYDENPYLDFVIHLAPVSEDIKPPEFKADGCLKWEFRKPDICPVGIPI